jgi:hypothetical protein
MIRLVQIRNGTRRRVALVEEPHLRLLGGVQSVYDLAGEAAAAAAGTALGALVVRRATGETIDYDAVHEGRSDWRLLAPADHPGEPARCLVSGTGLTHLGSAVNRAAMHGASEAEMTDSMRMFRWGVEGGRPAPGRIGTAPEWFYKGNGAILRAPGEPLDVPPYAEDGGEEAEIAGVYLIDGKGRPLRVGMAVGNEFSDHRFERKNYLNLAGSKIRTCSIGPELTIDPDFRSVAGKVAIERGGGVLWSQSIQTGEAEMCHSLANIEHHHFKFECHRRPGDLHIHYYGAHSLSFGAGLQLADGDVMAIEFDGFGRSLRNPLRVVPGPAALVTVSSLA